MRWIDWLGKENLWWEQLLQKYCRGIKWCNKCIELIDLEEEILWKEQLWQKYYARWYGAINERNKLIWKRKITGENNCDRNIVKELIDLRKENSVERTIVIEILWRN